MRFSALPRLSLVPVPVLLPRTLSALVTLLALAGVASPDPVGAQGPAGTQGATGTDLAGHVELLDKSGHLPARGESLEDVVVWFEPLWANPGVAPGRAELSTWRKSFVPRVLPVTAGSTVRFPNRDPILHNAFSVSRGNAFDLGLVEQGPGDEVVFDRPGVARVFCNVHHDMVAYVLVLDTPYFTRPDARGRFTLEGVPPGPGALHAWHERAEPSEVAMTVPKPVGATVSPPARIRLEITRPRIPPHLNKFGRRYGRSRNRYQ